MASVTEERKLDGVVVSSVHEEHGKGAPVPEEPKTLTIREAIKGNGNVLWWSFFFAMSAIGW